VIFLSNGAKNKNAVIISLTVKYIAYKIQYTLHTDIKALALIAERLNCFFSI